jgi:hypothetical protein
MLPYAYSLLDLYVLKLQPLIHDLRYSLQNLNLVRLQNEFLLLVRQLVLPNEPLFLYFHILAFQLMR